jgi:hypothetical protein
MWYLVWTLVAFVPNSLDARYETKHSVFVSFEDCRVRRDEMNNSRYNMTFAECFKY